MPIEIRELVIKTTINDEDQQASTGASSTAMPTDELIDECVARVMDLMKQQTER